jgi:hypothetical protein
MNIRPGTEPPRRELDPPFILKYLRARTIAESNSNSFLESESYRSIFLIELIDIVL